MGEVFELHQGCQVSFLISRGNVGFLLRCCHRKGPHLVMMEEPHGSRVAVDSGVMTGNSGSLLCFPREVQSPFELRGGAWDCSRVNAGQKDVI